MLIFRFADVITRGRYVISGKVMYKCGACKRIRVLCIPQITPIVRITCKYNYSKRITKILATRSCIEINVHVRHNG